MQRALLVTVVVLLAWMAGRLSSERAVPATVVFSPPVVVNVPPAPEPLPIPPPPGWQEHGHNRFALSEAPRVLTAWSGIVAAPGAPVLAAWNRETVTWSGDDGATWTRHALSPEQTVRFGAVEGGWVHLVVSGPHESLWSFAPGGSRTVRAAPVAAASAFVGGAGRLAIVGVRPGAAGAKTSSRAAGEAEKTPALRLSSDHGATWKELPAPEIGNAGNELRIEADGALIQMNGQEAACGGGYQHRARLEQGGTEWVSVVWPLDTPLSFWLGPGGWAYGSGDCRTDDLAAGRGAGDHLCAVGLDDEIATEGPALERGAEVEIVSSGRVTFAVAGRALYLVKGGSFRRVAGDVPSAMEAGARVDAGGRLIGIAAGRVVRWSAAGWEVLLPG